MKVFNSIKKIAFVVSAGYLATAIPKACVRPSAEKVADRIVIDSSGFSKPKNFIVFDNFYKSNVKIDNDMIPDVPHGVVISKIIENGIPNANIKKISIPSEEESSDTLDLQNLFSGIFKDLKSGKKYDAMNLSLGHLIEFDEFSNQTGLNITQTNIASKVRMIKEYIKSHQQKKLVNFKNDTIDLKTLTKELDVFDSLSSNGVKIYVAGGNNGEKVFNLLSLINNSVTVGSKGLMWGKAWYTANNSLIKRWEDGSLNVRNTFNGFSVTEEMKSDIPYNKTTALIKFPHMPQNRGTSFATPKAIVNDFK